MRMIYKLYFLTLFVAMLFSGCTNAPTHKVDNSLAINHLQSEIGDNKKTFTIETSPYLLFGLKDSNMECKNRIMHLYIEGDGMGWRSPTELSNDPTPDNPIGAKLFDADNYNCKIYLARPCQYVKNSACNQDVWSDKRFSSTVISSYNQALDRLKQKYGNNGFVLVGYSGGGAIVTLLSAQRSDIDTIVTVAGNLDTRAWTSYHHITPLYGSLNPADIAREISNIKQFHLIGSSDDIMPINVVNSYKSKSNSDNIHIINYPNFKHNSNWEDIFKNFIKGI